MKTKTLKSNLLLLLAAAIWGIAFVAQRVGMDHVGPFTYNGVRFALGAFSLIPLILYLDNRAKSDGNYKEGIKDDLRAGFLVGLVLFIAASLQQIGLLYTSAGKSAFITGLYIVLVPLFGIFLGQMCRINTWLGVILAAGGLFLLCITDSLTIEKGDLYELAGAAFWAVHILLVGYFTKKVDVLKLSFFQFITCSVLSTGTALLIEKITLNSLLQAAVPILYGGICSVGVAYTLQVVGQKNAEPAQAAIILSMETVFAALGGWLIIDENLGIRGVSGCILMFIGMLLPQMDSLGKKASV